MPVRFASDMFELCVHLLEAFFGCTVVLVEEGDMNKHIGLAYDFDFFCSCSVGENEIWSSMQ